MPAAILAETWLHQHQEVLRAVGLVAVTVLALVAANRALASYGRRLASVVTRESALSSATDTRLRITRRLIDTVIIFVGLGAALSQFDTLDRIGNTVLASSAIAAAVIGFAARPVLANTVAGVQIAITQPLRVGDVVAFEGEVGTVEDVRLSSTWLRTAADARLVIPNERLAQGILRNDSIVSPTVACEVSLWLTREDDAVAAVDTLRAALEEPVTVAIAETTAEGVRLLLTGPPGPPAERAKREARLREQGLRALGRNHR
jgi:small-conductance mechanosensitive channel